MVTKALIQDHAQEHVPAWVQQEMERDKEEVEQLSKWWKSERFVGVERPYTPQDVIALRGTTTPKTKNNRTDHKLFKLLQKLHKEGSYSHTFGALDPVQVIQMAKYQKTIYVSGWQSSSTASTSNEPGPDLADYPMVR
jgi:isocitrate lyase